MESSLSRSKIAQPGRSAGKRGWNPGPVEVLPIESNQACIFLCPATQSTPIIMIEYAGLTTHHISSKVRVRDSQEA